MALASLLVITLACIAWRLWMRRVTWSANAWHLALMGLRRGEIAGLRWESVDLDKGTIAICETRVSVGGKPQTSTPKTDRSERELPLPASLLAALRKAKAVQKRERLALGPAYVDSGHAVVDEAGRPYLPDRLSRAWPKVCRRAGVPVSRLHDARHTCATLTSSRRADRRDFGMARARRRWVHDAYLRS